jgi:putative methionine-R-sulfoxide reductase with GAF domain
MNTTLTTRQPETVSRSVLGYRALLLMLAAAGVYTLFSLYLAVSLGGWQLYAHAAVMLAYCGASAAGAWLSRRGRPDTGARLLAFALQATILSITLLIADIGLAMAAIGVTLTSALALLVMEPGNLGRFFVISLAAGYAAVILDIFAPLGYRYKIPALELAAPVIAGGLALVYISYIARRFSDLSVRVKLVTTFIGLAAITIALVAVVSNRIIAAELIGQVSGEVEARAAARAVEIGDGIERNINVLQTLALNNLIQDAVERSGAENALGIDDIEIMDRQWQTADRAGDDGDPLVAGVLGSPISAELREFRARFPEHVEVFVTNRFGINVAATNRTSDFYQADEDWWLAAFNNGVGGVYVGQPEFDGSAGVFSIIMAVPISADDRPEIVGILRTSLSLDILQDLVAADLTGAGGEIDLVFENGPVSGAVIRQGTGGSEGFATLLPDSLETLANLGSGAEEAVYEGEPSLVSRSPVTVRDPARNRFFELLGWSVIAHQDLDEALEPVTATTRTTVLISMVVLALSSLVGYGVATLVTGPITDLTEAAEAVRGGDLHAVARISTGDEIGALGASFNSMTGQLRGLIGTLEQRIADRTKALQTSTEVSRRLSTILDERQLVLEVVEQVRSAFDYYHAHIYLFDEDEGSLVLVGGTGEAGKKMLSDGHRIARGRGLVGRAAELNAPVLVPDVAADEDWLPNPLLPETKAELSVPIALGNRVLGVIDIQEDERGGLDEQDAELIQAIANQVAIGLQNARSYGATQQEARREAMINTISQEIQRTTTIESALQVAVRELGRVLGARKTSVELHAPVGEDGMGEKA